MEPDSDSLFFFFLKPVAWTSVKYRALMRESAFQTVQTPKAPNVTWKQQKGGKNDQSRGEDNVCMAVPANYSRFCATHLAALLYSMDNPPGTLVRLFIWTENYRSFHKASLAALQDITLQQGLIYLCAGSHRVAHIIPEDTLCTCSPCQNRFFKHNVTGVFILLTNIHREWLVKRDNSLVTIQGQVDIFYLIYTNILKAHVFARGQNTWLDLFLGKLEPSVFVLWNFSSSTQYETPNIHPHAQLKSDVWSPLP